MECPTRDELRRKATEILENMVALAKQQIASLQGVSKSGSSWRLDKELGRVFSEKERAFGALGQHRKEHGC